MHLFAKPTTRTAVAAAMLAAAFVSTSRAQPAIPGYYNPLTNTFHPRVRVQPAAGATTQTGTIDVAVDVTLVSSIPSGAQVQCDVTFTATDSSGDYSTVESDVAASLSGKAGRCSTALPYEVAVQGTASYSVQVTVYAGVNAGLPVRYATLPTVTSTSFPANGATTKLSLRGVL